MKTILNYYSYNIENKFELEQYSHLVYRLKKMGLKMFDTHSPYSFDSKWDEFWQKIKAANGTEVELNTEHLFENQWNTAPTNGDKHGLRLMDWEQPIFPNKKIKQGYWLEQTHEMKTIRTEVHKCGYCGKQYLLPSQQFCDNCVGSEYLKENQLHMLLLLPVNRGSDRSIDTPIPTELLTDYKVKQRYGRTKRLAESFRYSMVKHQKEIASDNKHFEFCQWMIDHDENFTDNIIHYSHTDEMCIGWRDALSQEDAERITTKLKNDGTFDLYNVKIKKIS